MKSKLVPISRLIQRRFLWVCNLVPENLWDDDYVMAEHNNEVYNDDHQNEDIILDSDALQTEDYFNTKIKSLNFIYYV